MLIQTKGIDELSFKDEKPTACINRRKIIKKGKKQLKHSHSTTQSQTSFMDENTRMNSQEQTKNQVMSPYKNIILLLKSLIKRMRYSLDTYLVSLLMLNSIKIQIQPSKYKIVAAALILISAKVHEFRTPKYFDLMNWSHHEFSSQLLTSAEAEILLLFNFKVPILEENYTLKMVEEKINEIESIYLTV